MSMIDAIPLLAGAGGDYQISRSVRLRSSASAYFNWTSGTPTSGSIFTHSFWVKRGVFGAQQTLISGQRPTNFDRIYFTATDTLVYQWNDGTSNLLYLETTQVFRDPSAWYHIVVATDTTQATSSNRAKIYVNGVQVTAFSTATYPTQNSTSYLNRNATTLNLGRTTTAAFYFDGYLTEVNFIDGQALTPSSFGETNPVTGVWQPKKYAGTYGTNGFYLNFSDNSGVTATTIGKDYSGNGNNWTPSAGISITAGTTYDSMIDVPTLYADGGNGRGNYAVMNPIVPATSFTPKGGNLDVSATGTFSGSGIGTASTIAVTGSYYFEITLTTNSNANAYFGVSSNENISNATGYTSTSWAFAPLGSGAGNKYTNSSSTAFAGGSYTANGAGVVFGVAVDATNGKFYVRDASGWINGTSVDATPTTAVYTGLPSILYPAIGMQSGTSQTVAASINFGQRPFTYTPPTGFKALNTQNLPTPTISNGALYMAATTYTGNGTTQSISNAVNGVSFQPDFVWFKNRTGANNHALYDSVRGRALGLISNATNAEQSASAGNDLVSFDSNGVSLGPVEDFTSVNGSVQSIVAWQWNAGGSTVTNTSGTISAQVRANATAGFSIVTCTFGNGSIGHGLGVAPKMIIGKGRGPTTGNWIVFHSGLANMTDKYLNLNGTAAVATLGTAVSAPTSTLFYGNGGYLPNAESAIFYCFAAVAGYSAFGSYTGNGVPDGPFVYLGFRPRWLMVKASTASPAGGWIIYDTARDTINQATKDIRADLPNGEPVSSGPFDILSNGFKLRGADTNSNGGSNTYIYAAFAENPFKNSLAR